MKEVRMNEDRPPLHVELFYRCVLLIEVVSFRFCWLEERIFVRVNRFHRRRAALARLQARAAAATKHQTREQKSPLQTL
jgi:hypothetical protein